MPKKSPLTLRKPRFGYDYIDDSRHVSVHTFRVNMHYAKLKIVERWDLTRLNRLCDAVHVSVWEMASTLGVRHSDMERYMGEGQFPLPVCLLLTMLEGYYIGALTDKGILKDFFPKFNVEESTSDRLPET